MKSLIATLAAVASLLGTIDPAGAANNSNFRLIQGNINGGWISAAKLTPVPEPATLGLWLTGAGLLAALGRRRARGQLGQHLWR